MTTAPKFSTTMRVGVVPAAPFGNCKADGRALWVARGLTGTGEQVNLVEQVGRGADLSQVSQVQQDEALWASS